MRPAEALVRALLERSGIRIGGQARHDIQVHDPRLYERVLRDGSLGLGETYMEGLWDSPAVDETICRLLRARIPESLRARPRDLLAAARARILNFQSLGRAFEIGSRHYDIGNDLYEAMLDPLMVYSCAYWKGARSLEEAQRTKLDLVCRKIGVKPAMKVLDIGCGWGGFARYAAELYGAQVTGTTVAQAQAHWAVEHCRGMPVEIRIEDYRSTRGSYDAVVSLGMLEHVGPKNYRTYMQVVKRCLAPEGVALIQTITGNVSQRSTDPWIDRYIFPHGVLPSLAQIARSMEGIFVVEDVHNFGPDYDPTLMAWHENLSQAWPRLAPRYDERFRRMWRYYLLSCAAGFRARRSQLLQLVLTPIGAPQPAARLG